MDYSGNAYDDIIRSAIRMQADHGRDPGSRRAAAALEPMCALFLRGCCTCRLSIHDAVCHNILGQGAPACIICVIMFQSFLVHLVC